MTSPNPAEPRMILAALRYAGLGIPVFPVHTVVNGNCTCGENCGRNAGKHPITDRALGLFRGWQDATTDQEMVKAMWGRHPFANIGAQTGVAFDVLDIDGPTGIASYSELVSEIGGEPMTMARSQTGRSDGGGHLFVFPPAASSGTPRPGLDVKGRGGYVILPPSRHLSGQRYVWTDEPGTISGTVPWADVVPILAKREPQARAAALPEAREGGNTGDGFARPTAPSTAGFAQVVWDRLHEELGQAPEGGRWQTLATDVIFDVARMIVGGTTTRDQALPTLEAGARSIGLDEREIRRIPGILDQAIGRVREPIRPTKGRDFTGTQVPDVPVLPRDEWESREWDDIEPWDDSEGYRASAGIEFPVEVFGPDVADALRTIADEMQVPVDLPAMMFLGALSACVRGRARVQIHAGWDEPLNVWLIVVADVGELKSPVLSRMTGPLNEMEQERREAMAPAVAEAKQALKIAEMRVQNAERRLASVKALDDTLPAEEALREAMRKRDSIVVPNPPTFLVGDMTVEAMCEQLHLQGGALAHLSAEGGFLDSMLSGRYSGGVTLITELLKAHDGREPIRVSRKGKENLEIDSPCLTLGLAVQPSVLEIMRSSPVAESRGLNARFLYSVPPSRIGEREFGLHHVDPERTEQASQVLREVLRSIDLGLLTCDDGRREGLRDSVFVSPKDSSPDPSKPLKVRTRSSSSSSNLFYAYRQAIEGRRHRIRGDLNELGGWEGKIDGQVMRLAGLIHLVRLWGREHYNTDTQMHKKPEAGCLPDVPAETMLSAIRLMDYFIAHVFEARGIMREGYAPNLESRRVLSWLSRNAQEVVSFREIHQAVRKKGSVLWKASGVQAALDELARRGYVRPFHVERPEGSRGRPPGPSYLVHPDVLSGEFE